MPDTVSDAQRERLAVLDLSLRVGEVLLSSGAGAADVTATMRAVSGQLGLRGADVDITFTTLVMSYQDGPDDPPTLARRQVQHRALDYEHLTLVDHLVRNIMRGELDAREARTELRRIVSTGHSRHRWAVTLGWGLMCGGVAAQLGGEPAVVLLAAISAMLIDRAQMSMTRRRLPGFYQQVAGGGIASLIAVGAAASPLDFDVSRVVTANIVMLLAGIGFMGGLQDALSGFYITGGARLTEAILSTGGLIAGVGGGIGMAGVLGVDLPTIDPGDAGGVQGAALLVIGSGVCASAFGYATYAPRRSLVPIAVVAAIAAAIYTALREPGLSRTWAAAFAALFIGLVAYGVAGRMRVPPLVIVVCAMVPLLPGLSIYRGLALLSTGDRRDGVLGLLGIITAASVALALASGVILGEYLTQPLKREARKLESRLAGPRLVGPIRIIGHERRERGGRRQRPEQPRGPDGSRRPPRRGDSRE